MSSLLHPGFTAALPVLTGPSSGAALPVGDIEGRRRAHTAALAELGRIYKSKMQKLTDCPVTRREYTTTTSDGHSLDIHHYFWKKQDTGDTDHQLRKERNATNLTPAVLHIHGGGMIMGSIEESAGLCEGYVGGTRVPFFTIQYRLAPEYPHPTPVNDCYTALEWIHKHADELLIDKERIAIMGESAGGGIAACLGLLARDRMLNPPIAKQILIYPMLDDRTTICIPEIDQIGVWTSADNLTEWGALLGSKRGEDDVSPYAAAARAQTVEGLPATYLDVGTLDIFRDEIMAYAQRLVAAGTEVEFHLYPGVPHAFEIAQGFAITDIAALNRKRAIERLWDQLRG